MILVLDACTIANILNVFQDSIYVRMLTQDFDRVYVPHKVYEELNAHMKDYVQFYNNIGELQQLYSDAAIETFIHPEGYSKECRGFINRFAAQKHLSFKENTGEFHSSALSLELSRKEKGLHAPKIIFATDDAKAEEAYNILFRSNQVGLIIDSIDLIHLMYIKNTIDKADVQKFLEGIFGVYNRNLNGLIRKLEELRAVSPNSTTLQSLVTKLLSLTSEGDFDEVLKFSQERSYKQIIRKQHGLQGLIKMVIESGSVVRNNYFRARIKEFRSNLMWIPS